MNILETPITYGEKIYITHKEQGLKDIPIKNVLDLIKSDIYKKHTEYLRNEKDKDKRDAYKAKHLACAMFNGTFEQRSKAGLTNSSGFMVLDYDETYNEDAEPIRKILEDDMHVFSVFKSPSGALKFLVRIPQVKTDEEFKHYYESVREHYEGLNVKLDTSGKDISRVCYLTHDKEIYINLHSLIYTKKRENKPIVETFKEEPKESPQEKLITKEQVEKDSLAEQWINYIKTNVLTSNMDRNNAVLKNVVYYYKDLGYSDNEVLSNCNILLKSFEGDTAKFRVKSWIDQYDAGGKSFNRGEVAAWIKKFEIGGIDLSYEYKKSRETKEENEDIEYFSASKILSMDIPKIQWSVNNLLVKGGITVIGGDSGAGKSLLALNTSMHLSAGKPLFDSFDCERSKVLYLDEENNINTIKERIEQLSITRGINEGLENIEFAIMNDIKLDNNIKKFNKIMEEVKPDVVIIDSLVRFVSGDENSSNDIKAVFDTLKTYIKESNTSFILLHHTTKSVTGSRKHSLRGSGDLSAFADIVLILQKVQRTNLVGIFQEKNRHQEPLKPFNMMIDTIDGNLNVCYGGDKVTENQTAADKTQEDIIDIIKFNGWIEIKTKVLKPQVVKKGHTSYAYNMAIKSMKTQGWLSDGEKKGEYKVNDSFREVCEIE